VTARKRFLATLDIETKDGLKGSVFTVGGFYLKWFKEKEYYIIKRDFDKFFDELFNNIAVKNRKILCYVQNEDFDIRFVMKYCIEKLKINPFVIQTNSKILELRIQEKGYDITFRDSL